MAKTIARTLPIKRYQKIVATVDLPGVPEGTTGKVLVSNGVTWYRYWVDFDNGVRLGQVGHQQVCLANDWDSFRIDRAEARSEHEVELTLIAQEGAADLRAHIAPVG